MIRDINLDAFVFITPTQVNKAAVRQNHKRLCFLFPSENHQLPPRRVWSGGQLTLLPRGYQLQTASFLYPLKIKGEPVQNLGSPFFNQTFYLGLF
jgi:hypothetical protein